MTFEAWGTIYNQLDFSSMISFQLQLLHQLLSINIPSLKLNGDMKAAFSSDRFNMIWVNYLDLSVAFISRVNKLKPRLEK